jgi:hypothetical protein
MATRALYVACKTYATSMAAAPTAEPGRSEGPGRVSGRGGRTPCGYGRLQVMAMTDWPVRMPIATTAATAAGHIMLALPQR